MDDTPAAPEPAAVIESVQPSPEPSLPFLTAEEIEQIERQARDEGFAAGYKDGLLQAQSDTAEQAKLLDTLMTALNQPFAELDRQVEQELVALAIALARQMVRRELRLSPGEIIPVVREAVAVLPASRRGVELFLHPEDAKLVREVLGLGGEERPWRIVEDPVLTRGGCRVATANSYVDASVEKRLAAVIAQMLGTEREQDRQHP